MINTPLHLYGHRIGEPRIGLEVPPSPAFMSDMNRGCAPGKVDPEIFHSDDTDQRNQAKSICRSCPVIQLCHQYAVETDQRSGIWGGVNRNSNALKQARKKARQRQRDRTAALV
jgi:WhiB family transcriptional regulator, redox-sensing transcriptional regulator